MKGTIFDIKKYAIHDGPNIRTTIFFKGCPLSCGWCHNPEGIEPSVELLWKDESCVGCSSCIDACQKNALKMESSGLERNTARCRTCLDCVNTCPALAHEATGKKMSLREVQSEIRKDLIFYDQSKGGVTLSGGEPLMQPRFLVALLQWCGELGIHRAVDTCCSVKKDHLLLTAEETDLFLVDIKHMDDEKHRRYTGVSNQLILDNIRALAEKGNHLRFRIPLIEGVNSDDENIAQTGTFIKSLGIDTQVDLLPYHSIAAGKYKKLGLVNSYSEFKSCRDETIKQSQKILSEMGFETQIGG